MFDLFPDFIGCILISFGLRKLADVEGRFDSARQISNRLIVINIAKSVLWMILFASWKDGLLPFTFIFSVIEIIMYLGLCSTLYGAIEYTANLHGGDKHLSSVGTVTKYSFIFMVIRTALAFLPEAFELFRPSVNDFSYYNDPTPVQTLADYKPYAILFFTVIVLILGIYFIYINGKFFRALARDKSFCANLEEIRQENLALDPKIVVKRRFKWFFILLSASALLSVDMVVDSVNLTPDLLSYCALFAAFLFLGRKSVPFYMGTAFLAVISVLTEIFRFKGEAGINRIMQYKTYNIDRIKLVESGDAAIVAAVLSALQMLLFVFVFIVAMRKMTKYFAEQTDGTLSYVCPSVSATIVGVLSVISYCAPFFKAYYMYQYSNDSLTRAHMLTVSKSWETAQGISNVLIIFAMLLLVYSIFKTSRKASLRI